MERAGHDGDEDDGNRGPMLLVTESLDLPALDLSSMASPALTTDGEELGLYSAMSEGVSMATEDKDALGVWQEDDDVDQGEESAAGDVTDQKECDGAELDKTAQSDLEDGDDVGNTAQHHEDESKSEEQEDYENHAQAKCGQSDRKLQQERSEKSSPSSEKQTPSATPRRDSLWDEEDMTVECASPRDPVDLEEETDRVAGVLSRSGSEMARKERRVAESSPVVVHPLPIPVRETANPIVVTSKNAYSVKSIFPVVYEPPRTGKRETTQASGIATRLENGSSAKTSYHQPPPVPTTRKTPFEKLDRGLVGWMQELQDEVEMLKDQLHQATKGLNLQLQVAQSERKQLSQRNTRLKAQITTLVADLTRTKAEAAKLKVENELYAAKLPKLQAELSEETTQADEKQAATIQSQIEVTQLRAKVQVLQTRSANLDNQVEKLNQELRVAKKELRRRTILHQQIEEKLKRVESELQESKSEQAQEILNAKNKLAATVRRMAHDHVKATADTTKKYQQQLDEAKAVAVKAVRRRRELEQVNDTTTQQLAELKKRIESEAEDSKHHVRDRRELEIALSRAERTESSLRDQICSLKAQLHSSEAEKSKLLRRGSQSAPVRTRSVRKTLQVVHRQSNSPDRNTRVASPKKETFDSWPATIDSNVATLCSCCRAILSCTDRLERMDSSDFADDPLNSVTAEDVTTESTWACIRCPQLEQEIDKAHEELLQARQLHTHELKVQASAFEQAIVMVRGIH